MAKIEPEQQKHQRAHNQSSRRTKRQQSLVWKIGVTTKKDAYREATSVKSALRKQLTNFVEHKYIKQLKRPYTGYKTLTVLQILDHLFDKYAQIIPSDKQ